MRHIVPWVAALLLLGTFSVALPAQEREGIPHRRGRISIDGELGDWRGPSLTVDLADPNAAETGGNSGTAYLAWDEDLLWIAFDVRDADVVPPPPHISGRFLYQWDSIELYVDAGGNMSRRMDTDDFQFIIACDGRTAVLQGDPVMAGIGDVTVPKREQPAIAIHSAGRRHEDGYVVEAAIPFAAVGIAVPVAGQKIGIDLAWNDWLEDHPQLAEVVLDATTVAQLYLERDHEVGLEDPEGIGWEETGQWFQRAYRPWSWKSGSDFGYPENWALLALTGSPTFREVVERRIGGWNLAAAVCLLSAIVFSVVQVLTRRRHLLEVRSLMAKLESTGGLEALPMEEVEAYAPPQPGQRKPPSPLLSASATLLTHIDATLTGVSGDDDSPRGLAMRGLSHVYEHLEQSISVADLARAVAVSPRTLQRGLKEAVGCSPRQFITAVKMHEAKRLLSEGEVRVAEVAYRVGFESADHFSRKFKSYYEVTPSQMRERKRGAGATGS